VIVRTVEPERLVLRRILPFAAPAALAAFVLGTVLAGRDAGWSALIGVAIVAANLIASAVPLAWAARISATAVATVVMGGFVVRLGVILLVLLALDGSSWFSASAFVAAVVPATIGVLVAEMRLLADRRTQADLWYFRGGA
jgi:hypothetical protein